MLEPSSTRRHQRVLLSGVVDPRQERQRSVAERRTSVVVWPSASDPREFEPATSGRSNAGTGSIHGEPPAARGHRALALREEQQCDPAEPGDQRAIADREESR